MEREKAEQVATLVFKIDKLYRAILNTKDGELKIETGEDEILVFSPKSTVHESVMCAMEDQKQELERKLEAIK